MTGPVRVGLDQLAGRPALLARLRGARVGVLAHPASVTRELRPLDDVLDDLGVSPVLLLGPEHGYRGEAQDMIAVEDALDPRRGVPVASLYGDTFEALSPRGDHLAALDVLLVDLADVGARYYTFVWTALLAARAAARAGVHTVLLDRPNPVGGTAATVEGATQRPGYLSFVGLEPVPIRHGLTLAELVLHGLAQDGLPLGPAGAASVVPVEGWDRGTTARAWDRPFVAPSPNMPTPETALVYPGGCLIEGTNLSEGRGTTRPFEIVGAPWLDGVRLSALLHATGLPGFVARAVTFRPTFHKHAGKVCGGVEIHVLDRAAFRPVATYTALVALAYRQAPDLFRFRTERYEFVDTIPAFDLLAGSDGPRRAILEGADPRAVAESLSVSDPTWPEVMELARRRVLAAAA